MGETFYEQKYTSSNWHETTVSEPKLIQLEHGQYEIIVSLPGGIDPVLESGISHSNALFDLDVVPDPVDDDFNFTTHYWIPELHHKDNDAELWIFVDNDSLGYDGRLISNGHTLKELRDNGIHVHESSWTPYGHGLDEKYYFYAVLADSFHHQVFSPYSEGFEVEPVIYGEFKNPALPDSGIAGNIVFLDLNRNGKLDLHELPDKDTLGNIIPQQDSSYFLETAEPSCVSDSLGRFTLMYTSIQRSDFTRHLSVGFLFKQTLQGN
ncbi:MAG: hypothetical protein HC906_07755 [Bacteroidales bacterium]|nr:hypothetical protein [Bacteroidales bacterium]